MDERANALATLAAQRWRVALLLTGIMMFIYFGFILLIAFDRPLLGALVIVSAWVLIYVYVRWANTNYDEKIAQLTRQ